jgi:hypothetical protein
LFEHQFDLTLFYLIKYQANYLWSILTPVDNYITTHSGTGISMPDPNVIQHHLYILKNNYNEEYAKTSINIIWKTKSSILANNRATEKLFILLERGGKVMLNSKFLSQLLNY